MPFTYHQVIGGTDGITVVIGDGVTTLILTEEEFEEIAVSFANVMEPIYAARAKAKRDAEGEARKAALEAGQVVQTIALHKARLQYRLKADLSHDKHEIVAAWLDSHTRDDSPFVVERETWGSPLRPYLIKAERSVSYGVGIKRREVTGKRGGALRFATIEAAFKRAIELRLHEKVAAE